MPDCIRTRCSSSRIWERGKKWMNINMVLLLTTASNLFIVENYISQCVIKPTQNDCFLCSRSLNSEFWLHSEKHFLWVHALFSDELPDFPFLVYQPTEASWHCVFFVYWEHLCMLKVFLLFVPFRGGFI